MMNFNELENTLLAKRKSGRLIFESHPVSDFRTRSARETLNAYVARLGFQVPGENWIRIDNLAALHILIDVLYRDLTHNRPLMKLHEAASLAAKVLAIFDADNPKTRFYTNRNDSGWIPLASDMYDTGVLFLDSTHVGILWVLDEAHPA